MGMFKKSNLTGLGYDFVDREYLREGENEYTRRFEHQLNSNDYRHLTSAEIAILVHNGNYSPNWKDVHVTDQFIPEQIQNSKFYGLVRIGNMSPSFIAFRDLQLPIGIYNSQIISSDIGNDVAIHHVRYLSHFILGNEVILSSVNEMETSPTAKFGNGIVKEGESENQRIVLELCNENGGRSVVPFEGMQAADAYLCTRFRGDDVLQQRFLEITENQFSERRGFYSMIGNRTVIKNSNIIKDVKIGSHAYIKGVNKLKNLTINSIEGAYTQIGEGCELVNGIIGYGCRVFYGVKAVRFILSSFSQLKYGARLINSFLGDNSTISCCEVLNSLLFPAHEQHHNNSFLCAALVKGQSNMAAGATVGSNHNSRGADGEIIAGRGFWPGLCVSLKHNSRFASYTLIVKGDFLHELDIRMPFSLVSHDVANDQVVIIPGYWFLYNMYALMRNTSKFLNRDKRQLKNQYLEYDILAPDTVNEIFSALKELESAVGKSLIQTSDQTDQFCTEKGREHLIDPLVRLQYEIVLDNAEASKRKVLVAKAKESYSVYKRMITYYAGVMLVNYLSEHSIEKLEELLSDLSDSNREEFVNLGSQLVLKRDLDLLLKEIKSGQCNSWDEIHECYHKLSTSYPLEKFKHAMISYAELENLSTGQWDRSFINNLMKKTLETKKWINKEIFKSRSKDYENQFRKMVYDSEEEMDKVVGKLSDNAFINQQADELAMLENQIKQIKL
ncbi:DUF4954 family protein [Sphingobacterium alkalisoli]|uniref:DUF4954 family protein n=2 Tax=Sphingobacterium alkalisoli TaxID=1874115 RepID=A0A4U0GVD8_9SPHI|nr:DUF4954 family protein [Sphingobacterium alkalisoli]GGH28942.1 DUF4954 domain-containing protein [Sphingobacterium alkalisoli]